MNVIPLAVPGSPVAAEGDQPGERPGESADEFAALLALVGAAPLMTPPPVVPAPGATGTSPSAHSEPVTVDAPLSVVLPAAAPLTIGESAKGTDASPAQVPDAPPTEPAPAPVAPSPDRPSPRLLPDLPFEVPVVDHPQGGKAPEPPGAGVEAAAPMPPLAAASPPPAPAPNLAPATMRPLDAPAPAPSIPEQVVAVVAPLRHRGDGSHDVRLELRPAELGTIQVEVTLDHGTVHLSLHAEHDATAQLLHESIAELRVALEDAGLAAGRFGVDSGDAQGRSPRHPATDEPDDAPAHPARAAPAAAPGPLRAAAPGAVDLLL